MQHQINFKAVGTSLPVDLLARIDWERGDIPRSRFILRLLERTYRTQEKKVKEEEINEIRS